MSSSPDYVIAAPTLPVVPVSDTTRLFPVHRIYCVGQNYADHVREMGNDPKSSPPVFFTKPADALVTNSAPVLYPGATADLHYEVELVVALGRGGSNLTAEQALDCVYGYAVGVDLTRRDLQAAAKQGGKPWDVAKGFDQSAPLSAIRPVPSGFVLADATMWLRVNDELRQQGSLADMIWSVPEILEQLSKFFLLRPGDLIFTGTPSGVGAIVAGDRIEAGIEGIGELSFELQSPGYS